MFNVDIDFLINTWFTFWFLFDLDLGFNFDGSGIIKFIVDRVCYCTIQRKKIAHKVVSNIMSWWKFSSQNDCNYTNRNTNDKVFCPNHNFYRVFFPHLSFFMLHAEMLDGGIHHPPYWTQRWRCQRESNNVRVCECVWTDNNSMKCKQQA